MKSPPVPFLYYFYDGNGSKDQGFTGGSSASPTGAFGYFGQPEVARPADGNESTGCNTLERFSLALRPAEEQGDWLPARWALDP